MKRSLALLVLPLALSVIPGTAWAGPACLPGQTPGTPPLYCIPPAPPATPSAAVHETQAAAVHELSALTPAIFLGESKVELSAFASGPGMFRIVLTAKLHGKVVVVGAGTATAGAAGSSTIAVVLVKSAKGAFLHRKGALKITLTVIFKPVHGKAATTKGRALLK